MGLARYVYPRFAVPITSGGQVVPIDRLRAHALWYPGSGSDGLMVSGHVLYMARALQDATLVSLVAGESGDAEVQVEGGESGISHRLTEHVPTSHYAQVSELIQAIVEKTRLAIPETKGKLRHQLKDLARSDATPEVLAQVEGLLQKERIHALVPLLVGERYQLFTDATEALLPVSPLVLGRQSRLCFVLLSTDSLVEKRAGSPWLRQAAEWMVLPVAPMRVHPQVAAFVGGRPALRGALDDSYLLWDVAAAIHDMTGGWPNLCERFYERMGRFQDLSELRDWVRELLRLLRAAERDPAGHAEKLLDLGLGGSKDLPDLPPAGEHPSAAHEALFSIVEQPTAFRWEDHGRAYLDGLLCWERGLAVPRSRALELALRARMATRVARSGSGIWTVPQLDPSAGAGGPRLRWLHVSDFHFKAREDRASQAVLEALILTVQELRERGRAADLLFLTGDLAFSGRKEEYDRFEAYLVRLCAAAGVQRGAVHMVPGNHDSDRTKGMHLLRTLPDPDSAASFFDDDGRPHLAKLRAFRDFYDRFYLGGSADGGPVRSAAPGQATAGAEIIHVNGISLGILPLNSAWFAQGDDDSGKLFVGESVVSRGLQAIKGATLRVALMHHPLSDLSEVERRLVQERLLSGCGFLLRGHQHETDLQFVAVSQQQQTVTMGAGAAYQGRVPGPYLNRAHFVEVELVPDRREALVRPYPLRYEYTGHDRWTLDTSVYPRSYPTYLETLTLPLHG